MAHAIEFSTLSASAKAPKRTFGLFALVDLARERRQLAQMDAHLLEDLGIDQKTALTEARRPFWDVPAHWRK